MELMDKIIEAAHCERSETSLKGAEMSTFEVMVALLTAVIAAVAIGNKNE